ncbi:hypothetical protein MTR67_001557 [Solanum verrucosum]|uniref:Uncharacterized protein n=1 Tax=Solanum verrucosum TaxID=315347 RepID=A0AAF0PNU8_SOLVR|nr:hypothetical protein MTR67_001557 [Solanum verrucosum]
MLKIKRRSQLISDWFYNAVLGRLKLQTLRMQKAKEERRWN